MLRAVSKTAPCQKTAPKSKLISGVSVIFDFGPSNQGRSLGIHTQSDIVDTYGVRLAEELEYENVRMQLLDRKTNGLTEEQCLKELPAGYLPIFVSCDWHDKDRTVNSSTVEFSGEYLYKLCDALCFSLSEWGKGYVSHTHRVLRPVAVEGVCDYIRIKPFALNGPYSEDYIRRLEKLGEAIGRSIGGYLNSIGQGIRR